MSGFVMGTVNRFQWKCPRCKNHYRTNVNGNFNCPRFGCNNAKLDPMAIGPKGTAFKKKADLGRVIELKTASRERQEALEKKKRVFRRSSGWIWGVIGPEACMRAP